MTVTWSSWLRKVLNPSGLSILMSCSLIELSLEPVRSQFPLIGLNLTWLIVLLWGCILSTSPPVLGSQSFTLLSLLPVTIRVDYGCQWQLFTSEPWPSNLDSSLELKKSKTLAVLSSAHDTNLTELGENDRSLMQDSLWAWNLFFWLILLSE